MITRVCFAGLAAAMCLVTVLPCADLFVPGQYPTIQAAVNAASSGDTIYVAAGVYCEQVVIDGKDLTLIGEPNAVVIPLPTPLQQTGLPYSQSRPMVTMIRCTVTLKGLTFDGEVSGDTNPGLVGVMYLGSGGRVRNCHFTGVRNSTGSDGEALIAHNPAGLGTGAVNLAVHDSVFDDNRNSIHMVGHVYPTANLGVLRISADVKRNTVTGLGLTTGTTQTGIFIHSDAGGTVVGNTVTDHLSQGTAFESSGIIVGLPFLPALGFIASPAQPTTVVRNTMRNCREGILVLASDGMQVVNNTVVGPGSGFAGSDGIAVSGVGNRVINNKVSAVAIGISMVGLETFGGAFGFAVNTRVIANRIADTVVPINLSTGVTGTVLLANKITP